jgi:23S rRNA U2552 (ribose-2'-O)-methylase RlmE/FtsJ
MESIGTEPKVEQAVTPQVEVKEEPKVETPAPAKVYTQVELDAILSAQKLVEENRVKGLNKVVSKKDQEIEHIRKQNQPNEVTLKTLTRMANVLEKTLATGGYENEESAKAAKTELAGIRSEIAQATSMSQTAQVDAYRNTLHQRIIDAGLQPTDDRLEAVVEAFEDGRFDRATKKLDKILNEVAKEKPMAETKETPKVDVDKIKADIRAEVMKELGLTKQDAGGSVSNSSRMTAYEKYAAGEMSSEDFRKATQV